MDTARWFEQALDVLQRSGPLGRNSAEYIRRHRIPLGFSEQRHTGASWFDWRRLRFGIFLNARYRHRSFQDASVCSLIAHEAKHLEQGIWEALSVRGELVAWQLQYDVLRELSAAAADPAWRRMLVLDPASRDDLRLACELMRQSAGPGYHIDWLPLFPLPTEIVYRLRAIGKRLFRVLRI